MNAPQPSNTQTSVWNIWVRIIHASIILLIPLLYWSAEQGWLEIHQYAGITLGAVIIIRIVIGFVARDHSAFKSFLVSPAEVFSYSKSFFNRHSRPHIGHNPMGGYMVIVLILVLLTQFVLGLFSMDDIFFTGPLAFLISSDLSETITSWHRRLFTFILWAIALHLLAVTWYQLYKKQPLIQAMIHGYKPNPSKDEENNE